MASKRQIGIFDADSVLRKLFAEGFVDREPIGELVGLSVPLITALRGGRGNLSAVVTV